LKKLLRTKDIVNWAWLEKEIDALTGMVPRTWIASKNPEAFGGRLRREYDDRFEAVVRALVKYFGANEWEYAAEAYGMYLKVQDKNTDVLSLPFSKVRAHIADIPSVRGVFDDWREEAIAYARSQLCDNPQGKYLGQVEVPPNPDYYWKHIDLGLVLGHYAVSARVAPRGKVAGGKMKWQLYFEVTPESARFDFDNPAKTLPVPRWVLGDLVSEIPAVVFWTAERATGKVQPFPVYSHELDETFVCDCVRSK